MDSTISVSKGCFVFKNGATRASKNGRKSKRKQEVTSLLQHEITGQLYYQTFTKTWKSLKADIDEIQFKNFTKTMEDLILYVKESHSNNIDHILPAAALLTGINQPDHNEQFVTLSDRILENMSASTVILEARDCSNIRSTIENMVSGFIEEHRDDDNEDHDVKKLRRSQYTMHVLESWYNNEYSDGKQVLVVIIPGFECFNVQVLQDLVLILSSYCDRLPLVLVLGVATAVSSLHSTLPYHVTSKIKLKIFQTQSAIVGLNEILENVILSPKYAFHLSGKAFKFLTDIFLFYDFSVSGFVQGFKYCLMEHFFQGNAFSLCDNFTASLQKISELNHEDCEIIRRLVSFRPYVESIKNCKKVIAILTDDEYLKKKLPKLLKQCHIYLTSFRCFLEFLTSLVEDLPKSPLGRLRREVYSTCVSNKITDLQEFKECWQLLSFLSKNEFISKIAQAETKTLEFMKEYLSEGIISQECRDIVTKQLKNVKQLVEKVTKAGMEVEMPQTEQKANLTQLSRHELKEKLLAMSKQDKPISEFVKSINATLDYIKTEIVSKHLSPFTKRHPPLIELFVFSEISSVRRNIVGAPRAALHTALNNPQYYLQCNCCELSQGDSLVPSLPDLSVAYKLHLECGRMINLFDWLQAFRSVVDYTENEHEQIDPKVQASFTRAVAELQFLGYIKTSKKKTDHVTRLTW